MKNIARKKIGEQNIFLTPKFQKPTFINIFQYYDHDLKRFRERCCEDVFESHQEAVENVHEMQDSEFTYIETVLREGVNAQPIDLTDDVRAFEKYVEDEERLEESLRNLELTDRI